MKKQILFIAISLFLSINYLESQTRIQTATANTGTTASTSFVATLSTAPVTRNTLIAVISTRSNTTNNVTSITQSGATWARAVSSTGNSTNNTTTEIWYTTALSDAATAITINQGSARSAAVVMEYSGLAYGAPFDQVASNFNSAQNTAATTGTTATTTSADELWIGGIGLRSSSYTLSSITNSFSIISFSNSTNSTATNNSKIYALDRVVNSTGDATTGGTVSTRTYWSGAVAAFKVAVINSFSPISACKGSSQVVTMNGEGFTSGSVVSFNGTSASTTFVSSAQLTAILPANATPGFITVNTSGNIISSKKPFLVKAPVVPTATITNTTCPTSSDGSVQPNNIPVAVNFDNTKSQYINLGTPLLNGLNAFTLEGWVKSTTFNRNSFLGQNNAVEIGLTSAGFVELWSEGLYTNVYSPAAFPTDGLWHHIAGTGDGTTMKIYIDGELIASQTHAALPASKYGSSSDNTMIGAYVWDAVTPYYHSGQILKAGFWNRALTNIEIAELASTPHQYLSAEEDLIAGYNFFDGSGTTLSKTPSGTNGTFSGTPVSTWTDLFTYSWTKSTGGYSASTKNINALPTGTYNLAATFNGCTANSGDFVVASNGTESTAASSITGTTPICSGSSSTLSVNGGSLGTDATWKWYSASCGGTLVGTGASIQVSPTATTTYYVRAEGTCNTTACVSFTVTVNATGEWLGTTSTDWNTASNWCGGVPTLSTDVLIPTTPIGGRFPVVGSAGAACKSLTIATDASVTMDGAYNFNIYGNWINNGTFTSSTSTVSFKASGAISGSSNTTFHHLTIDPSQTLTGSSAAINITGNWTNNGTFTDNSGTIVFNGTAAQDIIGATTFNNLTVNNAAGVVGKSNLTVNGVLNLASASPDATKGTIEMTIDYGSYSNVLTEEANLTTTKTQAHDILNSNILYMGANAITIGVGDVTGKVKRTTINDVTEYSFGNPNTTITFNKNSGNALPSEVLFVITKGPGRGIHSNKTNTVERLYQVIRTGGNTPTTFTLKLHYSESELNNNTEGNLVLWDHHIPYNSTNTPHEHGKTSQNTTDNWIELSGHGITYLGSQEVVDGFTKYWMFGSTLIDGNKWLGSVQNDWTNWDNASNWTKGTVPTCSDNVIIANTTYAPTIPAAGANAGTIEIEQDATLNGSNGQLTLCSGIKENGGKSSWLNNGTFNAGTSTVTFNYPRTTLDETSTISGTANFYNVTVAASTYLVLQAGSTTSVNNTFTQTGNLDARTYHNTFSYTGSIAQTIVNPTIGNGYHNLTLSGEGTKTLPSSSLSIAGDLNLSSPFTATSNTIVFDGSTTQILTGTSSSVLNNLTLNNTLGLTLSKNQTIDGVLTLTSGLITTGSNAVTLTCNASTSGQSDSSYINGKLARDYCGIGSKLFPIGKNGIYRPLTIARTTGESGSTTIQSEQFETTIAGTLPSNTTAFASRFWTISQPSGAENYTIQIDGTGFTPAGTAVILKGDGTAPTTLTKLSATTPNYTTVTAVSTFGDFTLGSECLPPTITTQPSTQTTCESSGIAYFSVGVTGTYTYQWEVSTTGAGGTYSAISNGGVYSNATTATLTITNPPFSMNGYAYRVIVTRDCGGAATSDGAVLTVNPQPQGSLSANSICKGEVGFLTWTASAGTGPFTVIYNAGAGDQTVNNVISGTPFSVGSLNASTTYTLVSVANASCTRSSNFTQSSATVTVNPYITWTGTTSRDWQTATNWCGGVPTTTDNVLIPAAPTYQPVISSTGTGYVHSIIIENGASVSVDGAYVFDVSGNITNAGTISMGIGTLTIDPSTIVENTGIIETKNTSAQPLPVSPTYANSGTIKFNGTSPQILFAGTYNDVVVDNPQGVVLSDSASVVANGTLEIKSGSKLEIGTRRSVNAATVINNAGAAGIVIKSAADAPTGTLIFNNNENTAVQATVEMYSKSSWDLNQIVNSKYKWQFIGIPVQSMPVLPTFYGGYVRQYNEGGVGAGSLATNRWIQLNNQSVMEALEGYEVVMQTPRKFDFTGQLYNQDIVKTLSYTVGADYPGQHIIGNPYTAAIDIKQIQFGANTQATVYLYNTGTFNSWSGYKTTSANDSTIFNAGQYVAIPKETAGSAKLPRQIPSMQAFLVRTSGTAEGSVTVSYNAVKQKNFSLQRAKQEQLSSFRFNLIGETIDNDVTWLFCKEGTTREFDNGWDGYKMAGDAGTARIQSLEGATNYQINTVPDIHETVITARAGANDTNYKLKITNENMSSKYKDIYLLDLVTKDLINIVGAERTYYFSMTNKSSEPRFKILTSLDNVTGLDPVNADLYAVVVDNTLIVNNKTAEKGLLTVYDVNGTALIAKAYPANQKFVVDLPLQAGVYVFKLVGDDGKFFSSKVVLK